MFDMHSPVATPPCQVPSTPDAPQMLAPSPQAQQRGKSRQRVGFSQAMRYSKVYPRVAHPGESRVEMLADHPFALKEVNAQISLEIKCLTPQQVEKANSIATPLLIDFLQNATVTDRYYYTLLREFGNPRTINSSERKAAVFYILQRFLWKTEAVEGDSHTRLWMCPSDVRNIYQLLYHCLEAGALDTALGLAETGILKAYKKQFDLIASKLDQSEDIRRLRFFSQIEKEQRPEIWSATKENLIYPYVLSTLFALAIIQKNPEIAEMTLDIGAVPGAVNFENPKFGNLDSFRDPDQKRLDALMSEMRKNPEIWNPNLVEKIRRKGDFALEMKFYKNHGYPEQDRRKLYVSATRKTPYLKSPVIAGPDF